jgi:hypothetical protein
VLTTKEQNILLTEGFQAIFLSISLFFDSRKSSFENVSMPREDCSKVLEQYIQKYVQNFYFHFLAREQHQKGKIECYMDAGAKFRSGVQNMDVNTGGRDCLVNSNKHTLQLKQV